MQLSATTAQEGKMFGNEWGDKKLYGLTLGF